MADPGGAGEGGAERAGRIVEPDEGVRTDNEPHLLATGVGIDVPAAGVEEAAVHVIDDSEL
jgi:hypothetical protein